MRRKLTRSRGYAGAVLLASIPAGEATAGAQVPSSQGVVVGVADGPPRIKSATSRPSGRVGRRMTLRGTVTPRKPGQRVALQVAGTDGWRSIARTRTRTGGRYALRLRPRRAFSARSRVVARVSGGRRTAARLGRLEVYRVAVASWYGPGLYGNRTGCGGTLTTASVGVAHKSLPCGTRVTLRHRGRRMRVPVIDRGPYVGGREYDLTSAVAQRLGFRGHGGLLVTR